MQFPHQPVQRLAGTDRYLVPQAVLVRAAAYLIDTFLVSFLAAPFMYGSAQRLSFTATSLTTVQVVALAGLSLYFFIWEGAVGWTPGKRLLQLKVVRMDGERCGWMRAFVRNIVRPLDLLFFGVIGVLSMASGFKRQRLGDRLAGTMVVRALPLPMVPFPYVPADQASRRCAACGALQAADRQDCIICGRPLDGSEAGPTAEPWPPDPLAALRGVRTAPASSASRLAEELHSEDDGTRLTAARETLLEGDEEDVQLLTALLGEWDEADVQFVISIARTLDGWRPKAVLGALRDDSDTDVAAAARDALLTVTERERAAQEAGGEPQADEEGLPVDGDGADDEEADPTTDERRPAR